MTHINAFFADIEEKKQDVIRAKGELEAAVQRLRAHPDYKEEAVNVESEKPTEQNQSASQFKKR